MSGITDTTAKKKNTRRLNCEKSSESCVCGEKTLRMFGTKNGFWLFVKEPPPISRAYILLSYTWVMQWNTALSVDWLRPATPFSQCEQPYSCLPKLPQNRVCLLNFSCIFVAVVSVLIALELFQTADSVSHGHWHYSGVRVFIQLPTNSGIQFVVFLLRIQLLGFRFNSDYFCCDTLIVCL